MGWAETETDRASLPDARLKRRLSRVLEQLSAQPTESIPAASGTWADTKAAYRLCCGQAQPDTQLSTFLKLDGRPVAQRRMQTA